MSLVWCLLWLVFVAALIWALSALATRALRVERRADQVHHPVTADGWTLALHRYLPEPRRFVEPVLLCHGLGVNRLHYDLADDRSLARTLSGLGFDVWSLELRGHGASDRSGRGAGRSWQYDFDDFLDRDVPAALAAIRDQTDGARVFFVGHSLGGLLGYGLAASKQAGALAGLVTIAAPVWLDRAPGARRLVRLARLLGWGRAVRFRGPARLFAPLLGRPPAGLCRPFLLPGSTEPRLIRRALVNLVEDEPTALLRQLRGWLVEHRFTSRDAERDHLERLSRVSLPALLIAAERDQLAGPDSVAPAYERLASRDKQLRLFGTDAGDDFDFGHGDLLIGRLAPRVVYVEVMEWLEQRATPLSVAPTAARHRRPLDDGEEL